MQFHPKGGGGTKKGGKETGVSGREEESFLGFLNSEKPVPLFPLLEGRRGERDYDSWRKGKKRKRKNISLSAKENCLPHS